MIVSEPSASVVVEIVATPEVKFTVPNAIAPLLNVIDPVGVPPAVLVTVAVNITDCPFSAGFNDDEIAVAVGFAITTSGTIDEVLVEKLVLPL